MEQAQTCPGPAPTPITIRAQELAARCTQKLAVLSTSPYAATKDGHENLVVLALTSPKGDLGRPATQLHHRLRMSGCRVGTRAHPLSPASLEPTIPLRHIDLPLQIDLLRELGADFSALQATVIALDARPGSELLRQLGPQILAIHELVGRALVRLSVLDGSQYTAVPGSRISLETLSGIIASASVAASQLARAVADNPLEAAPAAAGGPPPDEEPTLQARHAEATPVLAESLATAAHHLGLSATCCRNTASGITRNLKEHPEHRPPLPQVTAAQYTALERIAQGGARRYDRRAGGVSVQAGDGKAIHATPFGVLQKHRLIRVAHTLAYAGQDVTVTAAGRLVLNFQKPHRSQTTAPGTVSAPRNTDGRQR